MTVSIPPQRNTQPKLAATIMSLSQDLYRLSGNPGQVEAQEQSHGDFSQKLIKDHFDANSQKEHQLINWTDGAFPQIN